jgi:ABC-type polysaccharide/polyol phosphate export permease
MTISLSDVLGRTGVGLRPLSLSAGEDLVGGLLKADLWARLGWLEVKRRYRRTMIGPLWTSVSLAMYIIPVGLLGAGLWHQDVPEYLPFLTSGLIAFFFISTIITESCTLLVSGHALFRNIRFEYSILAYALVWRNLIYFLHNLVVYALVVAVLKPEIIGFSVLLAIPGMMLVVINGVWVSLLCGTFCLRFRDVTQLIASLIQISMLITPIFWPPNSLTGAYRTAFVEINPLSHMIDIVRSPLLGNLPSVSSYIVVLVITVCGWFFTYVLFRHFRKRIAYWT